MSAEFRQYLFPEGHPRIARIKELDAYQYREAAREEGSFTGELIKGWTPLYLQPFKGVTEAGELREGLHRLEPARPGEAAPLGAMLEAAGALLAELGPEDQATLMHPVDAPQWQTWANPEFMQFDTGLRLEFQPPAVRTKVLELMAASLSPEGYELAHGMMLINGFLGKTVGLESLLNEFSYNFALYGTPHPTQPWGWQLYGHHCAVNCLVVDGRMALGPVFFGAEPNEIDEGPDRGLRAFDRRVGLATELMATLSPELRSAATLYEQMVDPAMPEGRVHPGDERHLAGAFQDNRVIPLEGICVADMEVGSRELVLEILDEFISPLPSGPRAARARELREHLDETWFAWIGASAPGDVFYYRIQSPVIIVELDHHCGVFLDYQTPQRFHVHTVMRTPHGNDYGRAWVNQWQQQ
ncbi:DUF3500 domain-containing protein [Glutamicibacter sp. JL.03c]|uniref:DUF3500 domain-containing protein n=1 Tax=Glutamicibacter sp. JL.03c TaxID=2984842 RepID=UPI0021F7BF62|nr:DUF3500 domain-containing protein [Glutamicibacter sp. JL.03c]UYQ77272.1 DUF3500 domain-containing protein [Glutamicibacter sp. JL.03c]